MFAMMAAVLSGRKPHGHHKWRTIATKAEALAPIMPVYACLPPSWMFYTSAEESYSWTTTEDMMVR